MSELKELRKKLRIAEEEFKTLKESLVKDFCDTNEEYQAREKELEKAEEVAKLRKAEYDECQNTLNELNDKRRDADRVVYNVQCQLIELRTSFMKTKLGDERGDDYHYDA